MGDPLMTFAALEAIPWLAHGFVCRIPGVEVGRDRAEVVERLRPHHEAVVERLGFRPEHLVLAEQTHGCGVAVVEGTPAPGTVHAGVDGLISAERGVLLGIHVADCAAVYMASRRRPLVALAHSGRRGTELGIVPEVLGRLQREFAAPPEEMVVQISPCIRPPHYEVDFAADIRAQALRCGVPPAQVFDCGEDTGGDLNTYYSYRMEKARTGRLLALLGLRAEG